MGVCVGDSIIGNVVSFTYVETHQFVDWVVDIKTTYYYSERQDKDIGNNGLILTFCEGDLKHTSRFLREKKLDDLGI